MHGRQSACAEYRETGIFAEKFRYSCNRVPVIACLQKSGKKFVRCLCARLSVKSKNVTRFALNDSIKVQYLDFESPKIKFFQKKDPKQLNIDDINNFNLYALIEKQFSKIEVDTFHLSDANLEIYRQPTV
jgi:hypothetical protein